MEDKTFTWTSDLNKRLFQLRFENDWLFKSKKQPWNEFRKLLLENGFPNEMTIDHVRKKWSYTYDMYKTAKKTNNKSWKYFKIFDKHFGNNEILDKYESWNDEWRLKLIICVTETKEMKLDPMTMWKTVERAMRCQDLPLDCCVQDMKGLWHHIKITFGRKHRMKLKKSSERSEWPLYDTMYSYFEKFEPDVLTKLEEQGSCGNRMPCARFFRHNKKNSDKNENETETEFQWSKDITETFIQIRLQHDWLFRQKKWAWNELLQIMIEEYGFPKTLTSRELGRKWAATFSEYQKAKATNNKTWVYHNLFELYLGESSNLSLNPLVDWQEEWVFNLISARTDLEHTFRSFKDPLHGWREVEKVLRSIGLPLDHSLLDLQEIWLHLIKTFKRLWWLAVALLLWAPRTQCREITHEDIKEAMLSLVHMIRMSEDKLERHEFREKALGEQVKKMLGNLDKKHRALEPLKGMISRLDERLSNVETILLQKEEREKASQTKINEVLGNIEKALVALAPDAAPRGDLDNSLSGSSDGLIRRLDATDAKIEAVKTEIKGLKSSLSPEALRAMCLEVSSDMNPFEKHITEAEKLLNKYETKLNQYNGTKVQTDFVPLNEVSLADEAWHSKMSEVMERQEKEIKKIQRLLSDAESMWKDLPRLADLHRSTNQTMESINKSTESLLINNEMAVTKLLNKFREMGERLVTTNEDVQRSLTQSNTMTERAYADISRSYDTLRTEVQLLSKSERMIVDTADNVVAIKKRFEYGVHQILMEVGELIKQQHKTMNKTVNVKLDNIETTISEKQTVALNALGSKIESEMSQVWRQIGIMHQQIMMSSQALNKLSAFSEEYVNASSPKMDKMKQEMDGITTRVVDLGTNLNFVIGELSVATREFRQMALGLTKVLNESTKSTTVAPTTKDAGPGPHKIESEEKIP